MTYDILAVIPARGGSKGISRKNLAEVAGKSLVELAVEAARASELVTRIAGTTDDADIAAAFRSAGAEVILRPAELAGDDVPDSPVFLHAVDALIARGAAEPDIVVNVRPTSPLRTGADIDGALQALLDTPGARSVKTVSVVDQHPYKMWTLDPGGTLVAVRHDWHVERGGDPDLPRQSLPFVYRSNGAVDAVWFAAFRASGRFHPGRIAGYVMDAPRALDVDTAADLELARRLAEEQR